MCVRDELALLNKYKKIMTELKLHAAWQRRNNVRTGGGPPEPKPAGLKLEITGTLLQLQQHFGHSMCGMDGFDCDGISDPPVEPSHLLHQLNSAPETAELQEEIVSSQIGATDRVHTIRSMRRQQRVNDLLNEFVDDAEEQFGVFDPLDSSSPIEIVQTTHSAEPVRPTATITSANAQSVAAVAPITIPSATITSPHVQSIAAVAPIAVPFGKITAQNAQSSAADIPSTEQFFPTSAQRLRRRNNPQHNNAIDQSRSKADDKSVVGELRCQFINEERERYRENHALRELHRHELQAKRLAAISSENVERLAEIRGRNRVRAEIAAKQLRFWDVATTLIQNRPPEVQRVATMANVVDQVEESEAVAIVVDDAVVGLGNAYDNLMQEDYLLQSSRSNDSILSAFDDSNDNDYMP